MENEGGRLRNLERVGFYATEDLLISTRGHDADTAAVRGAAGGDGRFGEWSTSC